jgi:hypothetical protein
LTCWRVAKRIVDFQAAGNAIKTIGEELKGTLQDFLITHPEWAGYVLCCPQDYPPEVILQVGVKAVDNKRRACSSSVGLTYENLTDGELTMFTGFMEKHVESILNKGMKIRQEKGRYGDGIVCYVFKPNFDCFKK